MLPIPEYWKAVADEIDAEDTKASIFFRHNHSVGVAREAILRDVLVRHTPEPFRVSTGFIFNCDKQWWNSRQCDVLVYNSAVAQPDYAIGGLVAVNRWAARLVAEVKTALEGREFRHVLNIHNSVHWLAIPTLGFAYDGWSFDKFLGQLRAAIKSSDAGVPDCIAVHRQNYLFVRSYYRRAPGPDVPHRHRDATYQFAVNFGATGKNHGRASADFLAFYLYLLKHKRLDDAYLQHWFTGFDLPTGAIVRISDDGEI